MLTVFINGVLIVPKARIGGSDRVRSHTTSTFIDFVQTAPFRYGPQAVCMVFVKPGNLVILKAAGRVVQVGLENGKCVSIEFIQAVVGAKPHEPFPILKNAVDQIIREAIFYR